MTLCCNFFMNATSHASAGLLQSGLRFAHVAIVGKYQAPGSRKAVDEIAHFLHDQGLSLIHI